ncbi:exocyst complex component Sec6 [Aaosphaeria arxii CBS 175.79]|uniref:Exocyst complex component Sec6 n=1 Tax=Aaosphaeria arxii CBS 175.79 TaxID=1450172 RepID=A0A6A5XWC0_9PLEO|nr:exocyst complex component Sec6 [Aaosphaeria arxii CBS 175.79]KAF2016930.1 exocyst complex component Sec6 [Aaosphaeria arxii CBS 175.79]
MADIDAAVVKLSELLRHPEDLDKIPALKAEFMRKKAAIDGQLRHGLREQLEITQAGMYSITEGQRTVNLIKEEMMKIDKLCTESQNMLRDFPHIGLVAQTHRNFEQVEKMKRDIDTFPERLENLEYLLGQDDEDPANQPNLLEIHYGLTQLRDIRDEAMEQIKNSEDSSTELIDNLQLDSGATVQDYFTRLDDVVEWFDKHIGEACINLIELVQAGNDGMVVRLALIIEEEEKTDKKAKALQDAQREYKDLASRFKSIASGSKELRGYKEKFIKSIEYVCQANIEASNDAFMDDPDRLGKSLKWYFDNLNTVKLGMVTLMPKKWKIFKTYSDIYHRQMHDWFLSIVDDQDTTPQHLLAIINWIDKYYAKMKKLGLPEDQLTPHLIDNRGAELVREYRQVIIKAVEEWMDRMAATDKKNFVARDESALDTDENGYFRTKTLGDMWRMLAEQLSVAAQSDRTDVAEGVIDAMFRSLSSRQRMWQTLAEEEQTKYALASADQDGLQALQDWLVAIANDQIACIAEETEDRPSYVTVFERDITPLASPAYVSTITTQIETLRNGYVDLGTACITIFANLIFLVDFRAIVPEFFTPAWYSQKRIGAIVSTFQDYLADYTSVLHPSLQDILIEELSDQLLVAYLSSVRNKGAKFRRADPFSDKIRDDVLTAFQFFEQHPNYQEIKGRWRVVSEFVKLLEAEKSQVPFVYQDFKMQYWDVQIGWIEAVLRSRDDFERSMLNAVKSKAAEVEVERGPDTIMSKVK